MFITFIFLLQSFNRWWFRLARWGKDFFQTLEHCTEIQTKEHSGISPHLLDGITTYSLPPIRTVSIQVFANFWNFTDGFDEQLTFDLPLTQKQATTFHKII